MGAGFGCLWLYYFHKAGQDNQDADALSCLPLPDTPADVPLPGEAGVPLMSWIVST